MENILNSIYIFYEKIINNFNINPIHFIISLLILNLLISKYRKKSKITIFINTILMLPGTFLHELSHLIGNIIFGNKIKSFNLIPKFQDKRIILGSVSAKNNYKGTMLFGSISPLLFIPIFVFLLLYYIYFNINFSLNIQVLLTIYLILFILPASFLSKQDISVFFSEIKSATGTLIFIFLLFILYFTYKYYFVDIYKILLTIFLNKIFIISLIILTVLNIILIF